METVFMGKKCLKKSCDASQTGPFTKATRDGYFCLQLPSLSKSRYPRILVSTPLAFG